MSLKFESFVSQSGRWPKTGRHILAQFDAETVVVYQAYRPLIGRFAARNGSFGEGFSLSRMSWIKPNFLWMMYRCGWASKEGQEVVLAVRLKRPAFDEILSAAVPSSFDARTFPTEAAWKRALADSDVRLQWDPDHGPSGAPLDRRAIQLGLRGATLTKYSREWIVSIEDVSEFAKVQFAHVQEQRLPELVTPREDVYRCPTRNSPAVLAWAAVREPRVGGNPMIARIWHGWTTPGNADPYETLLQEEIFIGIQGRRIRGFKGIQLLRRDAGEEVEFVTLMTFESPAAVLQFAGEDYEAAVVPEKARALLARFDLRSQHYEIREERRVGS